MRYSRKAFKKLPQPWFSHLYAPQLFRRRPTQQRADCNATAAKCVHVERLAVSGYGTDIGNKFRVKQSCSETTNGRQ
jgi:hypothetical protein